MSQNENKQKNENVKVKFVLDQSSSSAAKQLNSEEFKQVVKNTAKKIASEKPE
ncbi:hypothetical protein ACJJID_02185 [Microbulbifer sp. CnH-101-G]|uniref:hypothetical protein n=1 Tax=Microbulbifer sp. CnH-101-G TaxID=3243393 RepID=UPI004039263A